MKKSRSLLVVLAATLALLLAACGQQAATPTQQPEQPKATEAPAQPTEPPAQAVQPTEAPALELNGDGARGGRLYDKWWEVLGTEVPAGDQPLWATQDSNTRSGEATWRCKECHGWDYKGVDGVYGSGSHKTGFTGLFSAIEKGPEYVLGALKGETNPDHDFSSVMDDQALTDLTLFLTKEVVDDNIFVGADKKAVGGDVEQGKELFDECADCHGPQGLALNFGFDEGEPEYMPTIAQDNPWEFLNKMRYGQPGEDEMVYALDLGWTVDEQLSVLAYVQTLPTSAPVAEGGRLYDKWWKSIGAEAPAGDQPLWATQSTNERSGADTWRCKECHGWDYKGVDGAYGSGSHKTGFPGVWDAQSMSAEEITAWLDGSKNADHNFADYLNEEQINMLVAFIQEGLVDKSKFINDDKTIVGGDVDHGKALFSECAECHGDDGKLINFGDEGSPEYVGTVASDNPWEFSHKAYNGQPGALMLIGRNYGFTLQDLIDLTAYAQTLPTE